MDRKTLQGFDYTSFNDFSSAKAELEKFLKRFYPDTYKNYMSGAAGAPVVDLFAFVADVLNFSQGQYFNQVFPQTVTDYQSAVNLAQWRGLKEIGASLPWVEINATITVPASANTIYKDQIPKILSGATLLSRDSRVQNFYLSSNIDFTKTDESEWTKYYNTDGTLKQVDIPARGFATTYEAKVVNHTITTPNNEFQKFYEINLPDENVQQIMSVEDDDGNIYYEVAYLAQDTIYDFQLNDNDVQDNIPYLIFEKRVPRRFIRKQYVGSDGLLYTKIVFGNTNETNYNQSLFSINPNDLVLPTQLAGLAANSISIQKLANKEYDPNNLLSVDSLGIAPTVGNIIIIKYLVGGGSLKVESGKLNRIQNVTWSWINQDNSVPIIASLKVNNDNPAIGGKDKMSIEEIKNSLLQYSETQQRAVTQQDYMSLIRFMPTYLGRPDKVFVTRSDEVLDPFKFYAYLLSIDNNGYFIDPTSNAAFIHNLRLYLKRYKGLNDLVVIKKGLVANAIVECNILINRGYNASQVSYNAALKAKEFFKKDNWDFGKHFYTDDLLQYLMQNVEGIIGVSSIRAKTPTAFSSRYPMNSYYNGLQYEPKLKRYFIPQNTILEIRDLNKDIIINAETLK